MQRKNDGGKKIQLRLANDIIARVSPLEMGTKGGGRGIHKIPIRLTLPGQGISRGRTALLRPLLNHPGRNEIMHPVLLVALLAQMGSRAAPSAGCPARKQQLLRLRNRNHNRPDHKCQGMSLLVPSSAKKRTTPCCRRPPLAHAQRSDQKTAKRSGATKNKPQRGGAFPLCWPDAIPCRCIPRNPMRSAFDSSEIDGIQRMFSVIKSKHPLRLPAAAALHLTRESQRNQKRFRAVQICYSQFIRIGPGGWHE